MHGITICLTKDGNGTNTQLFGCSKDSAGYFPSICNEYFVEKWLSRMLSLQYFILVLCYCLRQLKIDDISIYQFSKPPRDTRED
jgi:hypothetical protein